MGLGVQGLCHGLLGVQGLCGALFRVLGLSGGLLGVQGSFYELLWVLGACDRLLGVFVKYHNNWVFVMIYYGYLVCFDGLYMIFGALLGSLCLL